MNENKNEKHLKTWDEAISELKDFIIKSKKEEKQQQAQQEVREEKQD